MPKSLSMEPDNYTNVFSLIFFIFKYKSNIINIAKKVDKTKLLNTILFMVTLSKYAVRLPVVLLRCSLWTHTHPKKIMQV